MMNEIRDAAIILIHYFYEFPDGDIMETAERFGLNPDDPAIDLVCEVFEYLLCTGPVPHTPDQHHRICFEAANLLESGWTKSATT